MEYTATLVIDGLQVAKVIGKDKQSVGSEIMHYAAMYLQDGYEAFQIKLVGKKI